MKIFIKVNNKKISFNKIFNSIQIIILNVIKNKKFENNIGKKKFNNKSTIVNEKSTSKKVLEKII